MSEEIYRLTLEHYIQTDEGRVRIEEPLIVQMIYDRRFSPASICLNHMMDMMRNEMLRMAGDTE